MRRKACLIIRCTYVALNKYKKPIRDDGSRFSVYATSSSADLSFAIVLVNARGKKIKISVFIALSISQLNVCTCERMWCLFIIDLSTSSAQLTIHDSNVSDNNTNLFKFCPKIFLRMPVQKLDNGNRIGLERAKMQSGI